VGNDSERRKALVERHARAQREHALDTRPDYYKVEVRAACDDGEERVVSVECFDLIDALDLNFYLGNALKYLFRAGRKPSAAREEDLLKCATYCRQQAMRDKGHA